MAVDLGFEYGLARFIDFRDEAECDRVRRIGRAELTEHANPDFRIAVVDDPAEFYGAFAADLVGRIRAARDEARTFVAILPVGPMPQYELAARRSTRSASRSPTSTRSTWTSTRTRTASPRRSRGPARSSARCRSASSRSSTAELRPPESQIHFPTTEAIGDYSARLEELGGADACYGGIGWCGHIAFWESHLGHEFEGDLDAYKQAGARLVELHPMTIMQNALHSFGGDWSWVPPKANTIGPREILGARHRSFWLDGDIGGGVSWQRFIARLVAHGPVSRARAGLDPADGADRLHDPRRRRRRRRDPHGLRPGFSGMPRRRR